MFVTGAKEWIGPNARAFLLIRTFIEQRLLALGYDYFYGGIVSRRFIYERHIQKLGERFKDIFVDFRCNDTDYILAPEYTFRVYDYLLREGFPANYRRVFYSQEMLRNESAADIERGKTFSFWQIGYEIFGDNDISLSVEALTTLWQCLHHLPLDGLRLRISDKRILQCLCQQYSITDAGLCKILSLVDSFGEDGDIFYRVFTKEGGSEELAEILAQLLNLAANNLFTLEMIQDILKSDIAFQIATDLKAICIGLQGRCKNPNIVLAPIMPKTWDAYTTFMYDARVSNYDKAVAGGGNLFIDTTKPDYVHSGAGIGVTRIVEHLLATGKSIDLSDAS